jgi:hypothetical protein
MNFTLLKVVIQFTGGSMSKQIQCVLVDVTPVNEFHSIVESVDSRWVEDTDSPTLIPLGVIKKGKKTTGYGVTDQMVDDYIKRYDTTTLGDKSVVVTATLVNGFEITEAGTPLHRDDFDHDLGEQAAKDKIKSRVWELLAFLYQCARGAE